MNIGKRLSDIAIARQIDKQNQQTELQTDLHNHSLKQLDIHRDRQTDCQFNGQVDKDKHIDTFLSVGWVGKRLLEHFIFLAYKQN